MKSGHCYIVEIPHDGLVKTYETEQCHIMHDARITREKFETFEEACEIAFRGNLSYAVLSTEEELIEFANSYTGPRESEVKTSIGSLFDEKKERENAMNKHKSILETKYTYVVNTVIGDEDFTDTLKTLMIEADEHLGRCGDSLANELGVDLPDVDILHQEDYENCIIEQVPLPKILWKIKDILKYDLKKVS